MTALVLRRDDRLACRAWIQRHSKSFFLSSLLLPARVRQASWALYAFCRRADDAVDVEQAGGLGRVESLRRRLDHVYAGRADDDPIDRAFGAVVERHAIPRALPEALLDGMEMDARGTRYASDEELVVYCFRVAATVGLMMTRVMGASAEVAYLRAADLGVAMQLTNIARDVGEDERRGRVYLPAALLDGAGGDRRRAVRALLERAEAHYRVRRSRGTALAARLPLRHRLGAQHLLGDRRRGGTQRLRLGLPARLRVAAAQAGAGRARAARPLPLGARRRRARARRHGAAPAGPCGRIAGVNLSPETLEHVEALERGFVERAACDIADGGPDRGAHVDFDVVLAGGGLSLVYGAYLAQRGLRVAVFDRRRIGCGHREWNISRAELHPLVDSSLFTAAEVDALVQLEYDHGICRWHGGGTYPVRRVLDCVVDAERLLEGLRGRAEAAGATLLDHHALTGYRVGPGGVEVTLARGARALSARVLVDGMGASSPHAAFDLVCPTVGGVLGDLETGDDALAVDPRVGEILVTTEGIEDDRQHIWEGFPGPGGRFTTYLFYYTEPSRLPAQPLRALYERFFATRPRYKRGAASAAQADLRLHPRLLAAAADAGGARSRAARRRCGRAPLAADVLRLRLDDPLVPAGRRCAARSGSPTIASTRARWRRCGASRPAWR